VIRRAARQVTIALVAILVCAGCADTLIGAGAATDRASVYDDIWSNIDLHYSFFEYKQIDWNALGARYRPQALAARDDRAFAFVVAQLLGELHDVHVAFTPFGEGSTVRFVSPFETLTAPLELAISVERYIPGAHTLAEGRVTYGMASSDVGYLRIANFGGNGWAAEIDRALEGLPAARSMIVDIRSNQGGSRALAVEIAGRFTDRERTFGYLRLRNGPAHGDFTDYLTETVIPAGTQHFTGAVFLLTNRQVISAAEQFLLATRTQPTVTVVGDTTAGASGGPIVRELANGWTYQMSEWIEYTPDRRIFEGIGLPPDVVVKYSAADVLGGRDVVLERALVLAQTRDQALVPGP
jgi:Peptidase family S41/Tricorn protease C1 domain